MVKGVPLTCFIRTIKYAKFDATLLYKGAILQVVKLNGHMFQMYLRRLHQLVLANAHSESGAYTHIKPLFCCCKGII